MPRRRTHAVGYRDQGDAAATARNILGHEQLYRTGILVDVVGQLLFIVAVLDPSAAWPSDGEV